MLSEPAATRTPAASNSGTLVKPRGGKAPASRPWRNRFAAGKVTTAMPARASLSMIRAAATGPSALNAEEWLATTRFCMPSASVRSASGSNSSLSAFKCSSMCRSSGSPLLPARSNIMSRKAIGSSEMYGTPPSTSAPMSIAASSQFRAASCMRVAPLVTCATICTVMRLGVSLAKFNHRLDTARLRVRIDVGVAADRHSAARKARFECTRSARQDALFGHSRREGLIARKRAGNIASRVLDQPAGTRFIEVLMHVDETGHHQFATEFDLLVRLADRQSRSNPGNAAISPNLDL